MSSRSERIPSKNMTSWSLKNTSSFNGGTTSLCIRLLNKLTHKREIQLLIQVTIEVVLWDQIFELNCAQWGIIARLCSHHGGRFPSSHILLPLSLRTTIPLGFLTLCALHIDEPHPVLKLDH